MGRLNEAVLELSPQRAREREKEREKKKRDFVLILMCIIYIYRCIYALYLHVRMWVPNLHQVGTEGCRTAGQIVGIDG